MQIYILIYTAKAPGTVSEWTCAALLRCFPVYDTLYAGNTEVANAYFLAARNFAPPA